MHVAVVYVFLLLLSILVYEYTGICFSFPLSVDILNYFVFGSIKQNLLWVSLNMSFAFISVSHIVLFHKGSCYVNLCIDINIISLLWVVAFSTKKFLSLLHLVLFTEILLCLIWGSLFLLSYFLICVFYLCSSLWVS